MAGVDHVLHIRYPSPHVVRFNEIFAVLYVVVTYKKEV